MTNVTFTITPMDFITALNAALPCADKSGAFTSSHIGDVAIWVRSDDGGLSFISTNRYVSAVINSTAQVGEAVPNGLLATVSPTSIKILATWFKSVPSYLRNQEATVSLEDDKLTINLGDGSQPWSIPVSRDSSYPVGVVKLVEGIAQESFVGGVVSVWLNILNNITAVAKVLKSETINYYTKANGKTSVAVLTPGLKSKVSHNLTGRVVFIQRNGADDIPSQVDIWEA